MAGVFAVLGLAAVCAALYYLSLCRTQDRGLSLLFSAGVFGAFVAGSIVHPLTLTSKRISHASQLAERVGEAAPAAQPFDQQALENLPNITLPGQGNIDRVAAVGPKGVQIERSPEIPEAGRIEIDGWAADPVAHSPGGGLFLIVDGTRRIDESAAYGTPRPDVPRVLNNPRLLQTGYHIVLNGTTLGAGRHVLEVGIVAADQRGFFKFPDRVNATVAEP